MKQITIYSTCQGDGIHHYLKRYFPQDNFSIIRNYQLILNENIQEIDNFRNLLTNTSIFIYQEMPKKWGIYSTDLSVENNILNYLPSNSIKIIIPYVFGDWYWGIGRSLLRDQTFEFNKIDNETETKIKYCGKDIILDMKYNKQYNLDTILKLYDDNELDFKYEERMEKSINILKSKEQTCDIVVSEYILKYYKKQQLFIMPNHPSHYILKEMTKQILEKLNIDYSQFDNLTENDNYNLSCDWVFSKYDNHFHNFEFQINCNDDIIKNIIREIYNFY